MAPSRVTRYLGPFWLLVPLLGCADDVELLSTDPTGFHPGLRPPVSVGGSTSPSGGAPFELGGDANAPGGVPAERGGATDVSGGTTGLSGGATGASGGTTAASGGTSGAFGDGGDPSAAGDTSSGGSPAAGSGGYAGGGAAGSCGGACTACQADVECASGSEWCVQNACVSCATLPDTCPQGSSLMPVLRNGCVGFVCAPSS